MTRSFAVSPSATDAVHEVIRGPCAADPPRPQRRGSVSDESLPQERDEVSHSGVMAQLEEKRGDLAPVVGLMVEEVAHRPPEWMLAAFPLLVR